MLDLQISRLEAGGINTTLKNVSDTLEIEIFELFRDLK